MGGPTLDRSIRRGLWLAAAAAAYGATLPRNQMIIDCDFASRARARATHFIFILAAAHSG